MQAVQDSYDSPCAPTANPVLPATTMAIAPSRFARTFLAADGFSFLKSKRVTWLLLLALTLGGFALRAHNLSAEGLSEDELNKLQAAADYRTRGLSPSNGEHPMLMKALMTASIMLSEKWNAAHGHESRLDYSPDAAKQTSVRRANHDFANAELASQTQASLVLTATEPPPATHITQARTARFIITPETALRLPAALFGALTVLIVFLVARELFGTPVAFIAATLCAFDPTTIGFNRIAKEDTFFIFFFLLASFFWLRSQTIAERDGKDFKRYLWLAAASCGAMVAAKYYPHFICILASYYYIFIDLKRSRWQLGKRLWLKFVIVMGVAFVVCNLTILLPGTWREMLAFGTEKRIGHDSTEFLNQLYPNRMSYWLYGVPVTFYPLLLLTKTTLPMLAGFFAGLAQVWRRQVGDGRFFLLFYFVIGFAPIMLFGGKFTRYYTLALPLVCLISALGLHWAGIKLANLSTRIFNLPPSRTAYLYALPLAISFASCLLVALDIAPHFRLYNNLLGGGTSRAGDIFPHDDFYDASVRDAARIIAREAPSGGRIASETPRVFLHYAVLFGRPDLQAVSLSEPAALVDMQPGDYILLARGRRYRSNDALIKNLTADFTPTHKLTLAATPSAFIYQLNPESLTLIK